MKKCLQLMIQLHLSVDDADYEVTTITQDIIDGRAYLFDNI